MTHCSAAKLCHFVSHGGQIILPNELAEVVLADWTGSVPPMPSAGQSLFLTAHHGAGSNLTGSNWDSAKSSPASDMSRYVSHALTADLKVIVQVYVTCNSLTSRSSMPVSSNSTDAQRIQEPHTLLCIRPNGALPFCATAHSKVWERSLDTLEQDLESVS